MVQKMARGKLQVAAVLDELVEDKMTPGTGISPESVWAALENLVEEFGPRIRSALGQRDDFQKKIDDWHRAHPSFDATAYRGFLEEIGYLLPEGSDFQITTSGVCPEIEEIAGPQLVVPVMNARYALNAANARWGSLYDALYGTDAIGDEDGCARGKGFNPLRGAKVVAYGRRFLDEAVPLHKGSHDEVKQFSVIDGKLRIELTDGTITSLAEETKFAGYTGDECSPESILLRNHQLHIEIQVDKNHFIGAKDATGIKDIILESAITTIQDFEDSVAAVDAEDKCVVYANWLGLMKGDLS
ncbi:MAG: hypothetical protein MUF13_08940, partial [Akkermansiaceae bacterium]|nr:hypothetical protein [Akkermansiaceae bacterium]